MFGVEDHHLRRAPGLAARLDHAGKRVVALHEGHRPGRRSAARQKLLRGADGRQIGPGAGPELEEHAFGARERQDRIHRVVDRVDEAGGALRRLLEAAVEPHGAVEGRFLIHEDVLQIRAERLQVVVGREVPVRACPVGDRVDDAADKLSDAALTPGRPDLAAEILRDDDVGGLLRPELWNLDVPLLEYQLAALVADHRRTQLPFDLVERVDTGLGEEARERETGDLRRGLRLGAGMLDGFRRRRTCACFDRLLSGTRGLIGCAFFHFSAPFTRGAPRRRPIASARRDRELCWSDRALAAPLWLVLGVSTRSWGVLAVRLSRSGRQIWTSV